MMRLNSLQPGEGARKSAKRVGRGIGSGSGKTCTRGHKGQTSRAGGRRKTAYEGGQMPIQRRLPKFGFTARKARFNDQVRHYALAPLAGKTIDLQALKDAGLVSEQARSAKIFLSGELTVAVQIKGEGVSVSKGAKEAIVKAGGSVE